MKLARLKPTITREQLINALSLITNHIPSSEYIFNEFKEGTFKITNCYYSIEHSKINDFIFLNSEINDLFEVIETEPQKKNRSSPT